MNGRRAKQLRRAAAELRALGLDAPTRARRLGTWAARRDHAAHQTPATLAARRTATAKAMRARPPQVREYQPLGSRKVGTPRPQPRVSRHELLEHARTDKQARRLAWRQRQRRRRDRKAAAA